MMSAEVLMQKDVVGFDARLPLLLAVVNRELPLKYPSVKELRWKTMTGVDSRLEERPFELSRTIPRRTPTASAEKKMLIGDGADVFVDVPVLVLAGGLLHLLIRHFIMDQLVAEHEVQAIAALNSLS